MNVSYNFNVLRGYWSWDLTPLSTLFQLYRGGQFYWWSKPTCRKSLTTLSHNVVPRVHVAISGIWTHNVVVIGTDCTCSCKSNYHTITTPWMSYQLMREVKFCSMIHVFIDTINISIQHHEVIAREPYINI